MSYPTRSMACVSVTGIILSLLVLALPGQAWAGDEGGGTSPPPAAAALPGAPAAAQPGAAAGGAEKQQATEDEDDDDFDSDEGPVDRVPRISGAIQFSYRYTRYTKGTLPDGKEVDDKNQFQIEHTHLKINGDLTHKLSWEVLPCLTHMNNFSVMTAFFEYRFWPALKVKVGRFLVPFGQFNLRSLPGSYLPTSRPLLFQSHEDDMVKFPGQTPKNFIFTPREDLGVEVSGNLWFGANDEIQVSYNAYVTNGLRGVSDGMARFWDDNNEGKQVGGRLGVSYNGMRFTASVGGSILYNKWEASLDQVAWAVDAVVAYAYRPQRRVLLRAEYVDMQREIKPTKDLASGDEGITGAYATAEVDVLSWLAAYYQFDWLRNRTPQAKLNEQFRDLELVTYRHIGGVRFTLWEMVQLKVEYGFWLEPQGLPNAHRVSAQTIVVF